jgi:DNA-binding response OmpR family regulator
MIPARIVCWLRRGAFAEIGSAAEAIDEVAFVDGREAHPEWFRGPVGDLREIYALLDAIGWAKTVPPVDVRVDLRRVRRALMKALEGALGFAEEDASEAVRRDVEQAEQDRLTERDAEIERVGVLRDFIAVVQAHIDALVANPDVIRYGALEIDTGTREATFELTPLGLRRLEFALLAHLVRDPTRVYTKEELLREVWGFRDHCSTRTVDSHASRLRCKLARAGAEGFVTVVWGIGYRLAPSTVQDSAA